MHELSIAQSLIQLASEHAEQAGADRVRRISVRLGVLSGMLRPLYFCFESSSRGTTCEGAVLEIVEVPLTVYCPRCNQNKSPGSRYSFACPTCSTPTPTVVTGREMQLVSIDVDKERSMVSYEETVVPADCVFQEPGSVNEVCNHQTNIAT